MTATRKSAAHSQADLPRPQQVDLFEPILVGWTVSREVSWGSANLVEAAEMRARYIAALKAADSHDIRPLVAFARS